MSLSNSKKIITSDPGVMFSSRNDARGLGDLVKTSFVHETLIIDEEEKYYRYGLFIDWVLVEDFPDTMEGFKEAVHKMNNEYKDDEKVELYEVRAFDWSMIGKDGRLKEE